MTARRRAIRDCRGKSKRAVALVGLTLVASCLGIAACSSSSGSPAPSVTNLSDGGSSLESGSGGLDAHEVLDSPSSKDATSGDADAEGGVAAGCTMTISGGLVASGPCDLTVGHLGATGKLTFGVTLAAQPVNAFQCELGSTTTLATGTSTDGTVAEYSSTVLSGAKVWQAISADSVDPRTGSFTLVITIAGAPTPSGADTFYPGAHGTLDATLDPVTPTGATGTTSIHVTF